MRPDAVKMSTLLLSVTGISCGLIPAPRSLGGSISVLSKPSVARMVMTTSLRWEQHVKVRGREWGGGLGGEEIQETADKALTMSAFIDFCLLCEILHCVDISLWELWFIRALIRSLSLKFSPSGLICTGRALASLSGDELIEPNLNTHHEFDHSELRMSILSG